MHMCRKLIAFSLTTTVVLTLGLVGSACGLTDTSLCITDASLVLALGFYVSGNVGEHLAEHPLRAA